MRVRKVNFVTRKSRAAGAALGIKSWLYALRRAVITGAVLLMLFFGMNLIVRYVFESYDIQTTLSRLSLTSRPKYFIITDEYHVVYSNSKTKIEENANKISLPVLTGIKVKEDRPEHLKALKQALKLDAEYLENISEINLRNPENIVMITIDAKKIYAGSGIDNEKMKKLHTALKYIKKRYDYADIRYKDRVIIK